jgi:hypothetical protein
MRRAEADDARERSDLTLPKQRTHPVPTEFYLIIFLLASTMIFVFFYATRASRRGRVPISKVKSPQPEEPHSADAAH